MVALDGVSFPHGLGRRQGLPGRRRRPDPLVELSPFGVLLDSDPDAAIGRAFATLAGDLEDPPGSITARPCRTRTHLVAHPSAHLLRQSSRTGGNLPDKSLLVDAPEQAKRIRCVLTDMPGRPLKVAARVRIPLGLLENSQWMGRS